MRRRPVVAAVAAVTLLAAGCAGPPATATGLASTTAPTTTPTTTPATPPGPAVDPVARLVTTVMVEPPVDVVADAAIRTTDGRRIPLDWAEVADVARVPAGWLVGAWSASGATVWLMRTDGQRRELFSGADAYAVAPGGGRLAYHLGDELIVASLTASGRLAEIARTTVSDRFRPFLLGGDFVLMAYSTTGAELENFDTWRWADGPYVPTPVSALIAGGLPDASELVGMVPGAGDPCLAMFDVVSLRPTRSACVPGVLVGPRPTVSPDGRWLLVRLISGAPGVKTGGNPIGLIDLAAVFDEGAVAASWPEDPSLQVDTQACVWTDPTTVLCGASRGLVRMRTDQPGRAEHLRLVAPAPGVAAPVVPVVDLRR